MTTKVRSEEAVRQAKLVHSHSVFCQVQTLTELNRERAIRPLRPKSTIDGEDTLHRALLLKLILRRSDRDHPLLEPQPKYVLDPGRSEVYIPEAVRLVVDCELVHFEQDLLGVEVANLL